jgi:nucleoside 2-deoxyribosyltransferase
MRNKEWLAEEASMSPLGYDHPLTSQRGVMTRDHNDCTRADLLFVNLLGTQKVSIGTSMEMAWAWEKRIPIVCLMEKDNCHQHIMLREAIDYQLEDIDSGIDIVKAILAVG